MKLNAIIKDELHFNRFVIPYRVYGNGGPQLVCLNGIQQSMAMWHSFIQRFASKYRIVIFNFPGQGRGHVLSGSTRASLEEEVGILHEVIKAVGISNMTLCTASWGGVVAMIYAQRYPHMVKRLILGSLTAKANKHLVETIQSGTQIDLNDRGKIADNVINCMGKQLSEAMKNRIMKQFSLMSQGQLAAFFEHGLFIIEGRNLKDVVNFDQIQAETILLNGENDTIIDLDDVKDLATKITNCRMEIVHDVGHFLHLESEEVLNIYHEILP
jgi:2-succinyl-6-hydroxy-2,4-cyclohexadiene-1-carboxylate synthase